MKNCFLPPELWEKIVLGLKMKDVGGVRLISKFFNELILNNKILKYNLILASNNQYKKKPTEQFVWACKEGKFDLVKWLFDVHKDEIPELSPSFIISDGYYDESIIVIEALRYACRGEYCLDENKNSSRLETVKWLVNTYIYPNMVIYFRELCPFQQACIAGNLKIAKFLFETFPMPLYYYCIDENDEEITAGQDLFAEMACVNRDTLTESCCVQCWPNEPSSSRIKAQLEVVKWLIEKFRLKSRTNKGNIIDILVFACSNRKCYIPVEIVRFLIERFKLNAIELGLDCRPDISPYMDGPRINCCRPRLLFQTACSFGHFNLAKWIVEWYIEKGELAADNYPSDNYTVKVHQTTIDYICGSLRHTFSTESSNELKKVKIKTAKWLINTFNITIDDLRGKNFRGVQVPYRGTRCASYEDIVKLAWLTGHVEFIKWIARRTGYAILNNFNMDLIEAIRKGPDP